MPPRPSTDHIGNEFRMLPDESPRARFRRLAPKRVQEVIHRLRMIGNMSSSSYEYTPQEVTKILDALYSAALETGDIALTS